MPTRLPLRACLTGAAMAALFGSAPAGAVPPTTRGGASSPSLPAEAPGPVLMPAQEPETPPVTALSRPPMVREGRESASERGPQIILPGSPHSTSGRVASSRPVAPAAVPVPPAPRPEPETRSAVLARLPENPGGTGRELLPEGADRPVVAPLGELPASRGGTEETRLPDTVRPARDAQELLVIAAAESSRRFRLAQDRINYTSFNSGLPEKKLVALTFDDGPDPTYTPKVLQVLRKHKVVATFFVIGRKIEQHRDLLRRTSAEGHDLGNHTYHHFDLSKLGPEGVRFEIERTNQALRETVGTSTRWFRAPGCRYSPDVFRVMEDLDMIRVDTTNNSGDWARKDPKAVVNRVVKQLSPGDVILCHDNIPLTIEALPRLIRSVRAKGYRFVSLAELALRAQAEAGFIPPFWPQNQGIVIEDPGRLLSGSRARRRAQTGASAVRVYPASAPPKRVRVRLTPDSVRIKPLRPARPVPEAEYRKPKPIVPVAPIGARLTVVPRSRAPLPLPGQP